MAKRRVNPATDELQVGLDTQAFELLSENVRQQQEANRIAQQTLTTNKLNARLTVEVLDRYANQGEYLQDAIAALKESNQKQIELYDAIIAIRRAVDAYSDILREFIDELAKRFDRQERNLSQRFGLLEEIELARISSERIAPARLDDWKLKLTRERCQRELQQHYINMNDLREQAARYGMNVPLDVLNSIRYTETAIADLEKQLEQLNATASTPNL